MCDANQLFDTEKRCKLDPCIMALEFSDKDTAEAFQNAIAYIMHSKESPSQPYSSASASKYVEFEGLQRPEDSQQRSYKERAELVKTVVDVPAANPPPPPMESSLYPEFRDSDDEDYPDIPQEAQEAAKRLEFSRLAIQELSHLYSLQHILYMSAAHLYEYDLKTRQLRHRHLESQQTTDYEQILFKLCSFHILFLM